MGRPDRLKSALIFCSIHPLTPAAAAEAVLHGQHVSETAYHGMTQVGACLVKSLAIWQYLVDGHREQCPRRDLRIHGYRRQQLDVPQAPQKLSPLARAAQLPPWVAGTRCTGAQRKAAYLALAELETVAEALHCSWPESQYHTRCQCRT